MFADIKSKTSVLPQREIFYKSLLVRNKLYAFSKLDIPVNIYDYTTNRLIYGNEKFAHLIGLTIEQCSDLKLEDFTSWIYLPDLNLLKTCVAARLKEFCQNYLRSMSSRFMYSVNYRLKEQSGKFRHVLSQCTVTEWDDENFPAQSVNLLSDLSEYSCNPKIVLTIRHFDEKSNGWEKILTEEFHHIPCMLANKEKEILSYMLHDKSAPQITEILNMNSYTVRSHWRNILYKTGCTSQRELKDLAQKEGWI